MYADSKATFVNLYPGSSFYGLVMNFCDLVMNFCDLVMNFSQGDSIVCVPIQKLSL